MGMCVWIFVHQSNRHHPDRMSQVSRCDGISLSDYLMGSHLVAVKVKQEQHMLIFSCTVILNSVLFNFHPFSLCFLYSLAGGLPLSTRLLIFPFCDDDGSCLFPDAQRLFTVLTNNSALMEIFNIECWSPLGAYDGLLLENGIYERWSAGAKERACDGVNKWKTALEKRNQNQWLF